MLGLAFVQPLGEDWRAAIDAVASRRGWPTSRDVKALAALVQPLSTAYNTPTVARAAAREAGPARLGFAFARDVPKAAGAVRELVAVGALRIDEAPLRVLDVGAGLGATTWGLVRALAAAGQRGAVEATWLDPDSDALSLGADLAREFSEREGGRCGIDVRIDLLARTVGSDSGLRGLGRYDVILAGQVLSELDVGALQEQRVDRHAKLMNDLLDRHLEAKGAVIVVEPALRDRSRHLHRVRDALVGRGWTVFAPCLHAGRCPALVEESDWCHEDLEVDLPPWLASVARSAGLRRERLTYSYLVLRKDGVSLPGSLASARGALPASAGLPLRVVSELMRSKGKSEAFLCGSLDGAGERVRATRLDRADSVSNAIWARIRRGDVLVVDPPPTVERPRIENSSQVFVADERESH